MLLHSTQLWVLLIGTVVPLVGYLANHYGPHVDEKAKAIVHVALAAAASAIFEQLDKGSIGFDATTAQLVLTGVVAALGTHHLLWKPSEIATALGAGRNAQDSNPA